MSEIQTDFLESSVNLKLESLPLCHVSVEVGHLDMDDFVGGLGALRRTFALAAQWAEAATIPRALSCDKRSVRMSTCVLVDDYFNQLPPPGQVIPMVLSAAESEGLRIDYLALESACAQTPGSRPADLVLGCLVTEPVAGTTGSRPPLTETGWLTNGQRSPNTARGEAMARPGPWQPPLESARRRHSIFVDVELWDDLEGRRTWSCAMLAAVWQLLRLGLIRDHGRPVATPSGWTHPWPDSWDELPSITQLNSNAAAFAAYTTLSVLSPRFLPVEHAVRTILNQFAGDPAVLAEAQARARRDGMRLPEELADRVRYVFAAPGDDELA